MLLLSMCDTLLYRGSNISVAGGERKSADDYNIVMRVSFILSKPGMIFVREFGM